MAEEHARDHDAHKLARAHPVDWHVVWRHRETRKVIDYAHVDLGALGWHYQAPPPSTRADRPLDGGHGLAGVDGLSAAHTVAGPTERLATIFREMEADVQRVVGLSIAIVTMAAGGVGDVPQEAVFEVGSLLEDAAGRVKAAWEEYHALAHAQAPSLAE